MENLRVPSGCTFPVRPKADSTGFHAAGVGVEDWPRLGEANVRSAIAINAIAINKE